MKKLKRIFYCVTLSLFGYTAHAQEFTEGDFLFTLLDDTYVELTKYNGNGGGVVIPETILDSSTQKEYIVKTIGNNAFLYQSTVSTVTMPNSVTKIGEGAFNWCGASTIVMSENIDTICARAFKGSSWYLSNINFPKKIRYIGDEAFYGLYQISNPIYLAKDVYLGDKAFYNCSRINEITIEDNPSHIGEMALNLTGLTTVNILTSTPPDFDPATTFSYEGSPELAEVSLNVPIGAKEIYQSDLRWNVFGSINEKNFNEENQNDSSISIDIEEAGTLEKQLSELDLKLTERLNINGPLNGDDIAYIRLIANTTLDSLDISTAKIVAGGDAYLVSQIGEFYTQNDTLGDYMFYNCTALKYIKMPESVKHIGNNTFDNCTSLTQALIGTNTKSIGSLCFSACYALKEITIPNSVTELGDFAFASCNALQKAKLSENITEIKNNTFYFCTSLQDINIPQSVEYIKSGSFFNCQQLANVYIPKNVKSIEVGAFDRCYSLTAFEIDPENAYYTTEEGVLFDKEKTCLERYPIGKTNKNYSVPESVEIIQPNAFWESQLETIIMEDNVTTLGEGTFSFCPNLTSIQLSENIKVLPKNTFWSCNSLTEIQLPQNLEEIHMQAFMSTTNLQKIDIPEKIQIISEAAFWGCLALEEVTIPSNVKEIELSAFYQCSSMKKINIKAITPPICEESVFEGVDKKNCILNVPGESLEAYKKADTWKDFNIQKDPTGISSIYNKTNATIIGYYTLDGKQLDRPQKGINLVRMSDGSVKKILLKE